MQVLVSVRVLAPHTVTPATYSLDDRYSDPEVPAWVDISASLKKNTALKDARDDARRLRACLDKLKASQCACALAAAPVAVGPVLPGPPR